MGLFKLLTLAMATTVTASTFHPGPPAAPSNATEPQVSITTIASTTTIVKGPATEQPSVIVSSSAAEIVTSVVTSAILPTDVPVDSSTWVHLSSFEAPANNHTSTTTEVVASSALASGASSSIIVTQSANSTYHSATASGSATSTAGPVSAGKKVKVGAFVGLAALMAGVFGA
ncbi:hypothetical protein BDU57DRAFT_521518 [Ampelomyces quisqualis]|uniref:GPI anchored protein n=1 Tax=Ampelomyces quisqualis TaxID=50730 RepID=A0A6A5QBK0_AMPQU|nr:hypothetical protein BDU57DRAFT_521518 [Ampelomyces quisqualis]